MYEVLRKLSEILGPRGRTRALVLSILILLMALSETLGVASIMPFIAVLSNPTILETNPYLASAYARLGFESTNAFLIFLGVGTLTLFIGSILLRATTLWVQLRFINLQLHEVASRLVESYLRQPYEWFLQRNSAEIGSKVLTEVGNVFQGTISPIMLLLANGVVAILLFLLLVVVDPLLALAGSTVLGAAYWIVFALVRNYLARMGEVRATANRQRFEAVHEAFGGIKDVKVTGTEASFLERFHRPSERMARASVGSALVNEMPALVAQAAVFGGMLVAIIYLITVHGGMQEALPVIALFSLAGYRLMPALQGAYRNLSAANFYLPALEGLYRDLHECSEYDAQPEVALAGRQERKPLALAHALELKGIAYCYPGSNRLTLQDVSITVEARTAVAIVGATGSGKTTLVDIMLGLLKPTEGELLSDGCSIAGANVRAWQRNVGYVSQTIFLSDDTIAANIAFGVANSNVNLEAVERAARIANLHHFVVDELPEGYQTRVGERGVRLSGGQRQRLGIARALYLDPDVLIFDEATSALDNVTEQAVIEAVHRLGRQKTVVMIAHRLSTVRSCDCIYLMEGGRIIATGTYDELLAGNASFRAMAT